MLQMLERVGHHQHPKAALVNSIFRELSARGPANASGSHDEVSVMTSTSHRLQGLDDE